MPPAARNVPAYLTCACGELMRRTKPRILGGGLAVILEYGRWRGDKERRVGVRIAVT